jgi:hypothetical protein
MYFQKPADALTATGAGDPGPDEVAQLNTPARVPGSDVLPATLPQPTARSAPVDRPPRPVFNVPPMDTVPTAAYPAQDKEPVGPGGLPIPKPGGSGDTPPTTALKKEIKEPPGGATVTQLPRREQIFTVYNDPQLEQAIMDRIREDLRRDGKYTPEQEQYLRFPPLPVLSPPSVPYVAKTWQYQPYKFTVEPFYVVHRRLFFEEKNAERAGWDLGPLSTLVAATHFYVETLLFPAHLVDGCTYGFWDTSAGKCFPGTPNPYLLYPPNLTLSGSVFEAGVVTGFAFLFP